MGVIIEGLFLFATKGECHCVFVVATDTRGGTNRRCLEPRCLQPRVERTDISAVVRRMLGVDAGERGNAKIFVEIGTLDDGAQALSGPRIVAPTECLYRRPLQLIFAGR